MTKTIDVDQADREAAETAAAVDRAEAELASGGKSITVTALSKLRDTFRHAELSARGAHERAERDRKAARMAGLEAVGKQVDDLASSTGTQLAEALQDVSDACARVRRLAADHDAAVGDLIATARDLRAEGRAPAGPRPTSAFIALAPDAISHKRVTVHQLGGKLTGILALAVAGKPREAADKAQLTTEQQAPQRAAHYLRRTADGMILTYDGKDLRGGWLQQISRGELERLTGKEIDRYMAGEL